jgi:hypothetical protein
MKTTKIGRNDPCPCGSGKKYKQCCAGKAAEKSTVYTKWVAVVLGSLLLLGTLAMVSSMARNDRPAIPGRVWSAEHQHYH